MKIENDKIAGTENDVNTETKTPQISSTELSDEKLDNVSGGRTSADNCPDSYGCILTVAPQSGGMSSTNSPAEIHNTRSTIRQKCSVCGQDCDVPANYLTCMIQTEDIICPKCRQKSNHVM